MPVSAIHLVFMQFGFGIIFARILKKFKLYTSISLCSNLVFVNDSHTDFGIP